MADYNDPMSDPLPTFIESIRQAHGAILPSIIGTGLDFAEAPYKRRAQQQRQQAMGGFLSGIQMNNAPLAAAQLKALTPKIISQMPPDVLEEIYAGILQTAQRETQKGAQGKADPYQDWRAQNPNAPISEYYKMRAQMAALGKPPPQAKVPTNPFEAAWMTTGGNLAAATRAKLAGERAPTPPSPDFKVMPDGRVMSGRTGAVLPGMRFPKAAAAPKPYTPMEAAKLVDDITKQVQNDMGTPSNLPLAGYITGVTHEGVRAEVKKRLAQMGADERGYGPFGTRPKGVPAEEAPPEGATLPDDTGG